jgi:hypothetical protein
LGNDQPIENRAKKRVHCHYARIIGILGILIALFCLGYVAQEIPTQPQRALPVVILWGIMMLGVLLDSIRVGREGFGGLLVIIAGGAYYLFLILTPILGWEWEKGGELVELFASLPMFAAGLLFYLCGKRM